MLLREEHCHLACLRYIACALCRVKGVELNVVVLADNLHDVVDGNLALCELNIDLQNILSKRDGNLAAEERGVGDKRREGTLNLTHICRDVLREVCNHILGDVCAEALSLSADNLDLSLVVGNIQLRRETPLKTSEKSLLDVLKLNGWLIRCEDELLARQLKVVEDVEEYILCTCLTRKLLDVVDNQYIDHLIEVDEVGNLTILVGCLELSLELVHRDIQHLQLGVALTHLVTDSLGDVCLTQT